MKKKRMMATILRPLNTVILQRGKEKIRRHQMSPLMMLVGVIADAKKDCETEMERLKFE
jgi:hypothetical protein